MQKKIILIGALIAGAAVALGAFGAHSLKQVFTPELSQTFETAVRYQMYHAFGLLIIGSLLPQFSQKMLQWSAGLFIIGIILFSGSLYILCYLKYLHLLKGLWIGAITPIGGLCFIAGWVLIAVAASKATYKPIA